MSDSGPRRYLQGPALLPRFCGLGSQVVRNATDGKEFKSEQRRPSGTPSPLARELTFPLRHFVSVLNCTYPVATFIFARHHSEGSPAHCVFVSV
ncbi:hypothetical protein GN956_G754 [Arapaima gigas]